jgi:hypothetical protein
MPIDHVTNTNNGNSVKKVATTTTTLSGRTSTLPIYEVNLSALTEVMGPNVATVINSIKRDNIKDAEQGYRQPTDHDDRDGNLPVIPGNGVTYREYNVPGNKLPKAAYVRLVADLTNGRIYITPTHYDVWIPDREAARNLNENTPVAATTAGAQNPFFLIKTKA